MMRRWLRFVFALSLVLGMAALARSAPPPNADPALAPWFQGLQRPDVGGSCCSVADCRRVQSRLGEKHYEVMLDGVWVAVPPQRVVYRENPTGEAVVCARSHVIICFVPAPET